MVGVGWLHLHLRGAPVARYGCDPPDHESAVPEHEHPADGGDAPDGIDRQPVSFGECGLHGFAGHLSTRMPTSPAGSTQGLDRSSSRASPVAFFVGMGRA